MYISTLASFCNKTIMYSIKYVLKQRFFATKQGYVYEIKFYKSSQ